MLLPPRLLPVLALACAVLAGCGSEGDGPSVITGGGPAAGPGFVPGDNVLDPDPSERATWPLDPTTVQLADDGTTVAATCGDAVCRWDATGGTARAEGAGGQALDVAEGVALRTARSQVLVVDAAGGDVRATFDEHDPGGDATAAVRGVTLAAGGELATSAGEDGTAWLWRVDDGSAVREVRAPGASPSVPLLDLSADLLAVCASGDATDGPARACEVQDAASGEVVAEPAGLVRSVAWSPDGNYLVGMDAGGELAAWNTAGWSRSAGSGLPGDGPVAISADSSTVAVVDPDDPTTVRLWTPADPTAALRTIATDHPDPIGGLAWSADGRTLVTASTEATAEPGPTPAAPRDEVQVREVARPGRVVRLRLPG